MLTHDAHFDAVFQNAVKTFNGGIGDIFEGLAAYGHAAAIEVVVQTRQAAATKKPNAQEDNAGGHGEGTAEGVAPNGHIRA